MICNVGGMILINFFQRLFNAENAFALPNYVLSITSLIFIFCTLVYKGAVEHILVAYFLLFPLQGVSLLSIYFLRYRSQKSFVFPALKQWKSLFEYSLKALSANLVFFLVMRFDYWVVKTNCSDIQTGNYLQAARLGQMLMIVPQIMAAVILPAASRDSNNIKEVIARLVRIMFHIYILVFICIFLFGDLLVLKLFGSSFAGMNAVLLYSIPGFFFLSSLSLYAAWFAGQNKVTVNLRGAVYAFVFILTADLFFIPRYGIKAAAMISSIGYGINLLYAVIKYRNEFQKFPRLYDKADYRWLLQILSIR
jgi:O-antigen/teichoic acid export membrane protein